MCPVKTSPYFSTAFDEPKAVGRQGDNIDKSNHVPKTPVGEECRFIPALSYLLNHVELGTGGKGGVSSTEASECEGLEGSRTTSLLGPVARTPGSLLILTK